MIRAERVWRLQRGSGRMAMLLFVIAILSLADGLRGGFLGNSGQVHLIPGERFAISGPLPPKTDRIEDFVIEGTVPDGSIRLVPEGIFTGFMFGGGMWRGHIQVEGQARPAELVIKVRDRFGEKQNPALVFNVRVFADGLDRRANSPSSVMRWSGIEPQLLAACFAVLGLLTGGLNFLLGRKWQSILTEHGCGEVFRIKKNDGSVFVGIDMGRPADLREGTVVRFTHPARGDLGYGRVVSCAKHEVTVDVQDNAPVRQGDIACPV